MSAPRGFRPPPDAAPDAAPEAAPDAGAVAERLPGKRRTLALLALAELMAMALWFSASAVAPQLSDLWSLDAGQASWLTMSVQLGFVLGALASAALNLADRLPTRVLFAVSAAAGAAFTAAIAWLEPGYPATVALRLLTGAALAGVYPPGMKLMASWSRADRGWWIGVLVGALTVGSAAPHLLGALSGAGGRPLDWRFVLYGAAALALAAAALALWFVRPGPFLAQASRFHWRHAAAGLRRRGPRLANLGYLGHMWELYAMWTWVPLLLLDAYARAGWPQAGARLAGFAVVAVGGVGSLLAGRLADRWGRTRTTILSLALSGGCALLAGALVGAPALLTALCLVWGFAVVADSAQFSAAVSELADPRYVGTALTVQTSLGFLLTLASIRLVPPLQAWLGWHAALALLALGPLLGVWAMRRLQRLPEARLLASGRG